MAILIIQCSLSLAVLGYSLWNFAVFKQKTRGVVAIILETVDTSFKETVGYWQNHIMLFRMIHLDTFNHKKL